ncbi:copper chaperone PCu(A)C [Rhodoferax sp.]|uniref:copper chaperone PCu(A)C n=1 Tax=Rhodoferax sp. TaxID=50421 RepID=UPI002628F962|nr:copper chaperone PCu(A)C [Rhodoferax sp.]MDD2925997.1 copper chaperone PCu(A)C [Rhodoferax sp.]
MTFSELNRVRWMTRLPVGAALALLATLPLPGHAHGTKAGTLQIDHPYAVPSEPNEPHGKVYLRGIKNNGAQADRLLGASTPVAAAVKLHSLKPDANGLRGMQLDAIELPPQATTLLRHTGDYQLSLINLKAPLKDGDRFALTLNFEHAGSQTVQVWVQTPRAAQASHASH